MFIGHYSVAFAVKERAPSLRLGVLFIAVQALDILFASFLLIGAEHMRVVPNPPSGGIYDAFQLYDMPLSHSLAGAVTWSIAAIFIARIRLAWSAATWLGFAVFSHFLLDIPMHPNDALHAADLHVAGANSPGIGLGFWDHPYLAVATELATFWLGVLIFARSYWPFRPRMWLMIISLSILAILPLFVPSGGTVNQFAVQILAVTFLIAMWAAWVERTVRRSGDLRDPTPTLTAN
jgi:hypothetical protein